MKKLKIGLLLDSYQVPAWIYRSVERVFHSDLTESIFILLNDISSVSSPVCSKGIKQSIIDFINQMLNSLDERLFIKSPNAMESKNLAELLEGIPAKKLSSLQDGDSNVIPSWRKERLQDADIDVWVQFSSRNINCEQLPSSTYGVWEYQFGDEDIPTVNSPGYWEVIRQKPVTSARLISLKANPTKKRSLYHSHIATHKLSPARNRNTLLWFASSFLIRQLELLCRVGEDRFYEEIIQYNPPSDFADQRTNKPHSNWDSLTSALKLLGRISKELLFRSFFLDTWYLLVGPGQYPPNSIAGFQKLIPGKDRFWADPQILQHDGRYYVFIEEYIYKQQKGQISVIEMDSQGHRREPIPVLTKEYHLSYPFVFEYNHSYFMIPESSANKTIDLYACEEFPTRWNYKMTLIENIRAVDTTLLFFEGKWWLFTGITENDEASPEVELFLYIADSLFTKEWRSHPLNPVVSDVTRARPAGRIFLYDGKLFRPSQDCSKIYGHSFSLNEIVSLSETNYHEVKRKTVLPEWDNSVLATHTYSREGQLTVLDAFVRRSKLFIH